MTKKLKIENGELKNRAATPPALVFNFQFSIFNFQFL